MHKILNRKIAALLIGMTLLSTGSAFAGVESLAVRSKLISAEVTAVEIEQVMDSTAIKQYYNGSLMYNDEVITDDLTVTQFNGVKLVPVKVVLEALGYTVERDAETDRLEIRKGAQWTAITVGKNAYTKNRMAPVTLTSAPLDLGGNVYVPAEFLVEILGINVRVEEGNLILSDYEAVVHAGYIANITYDETGAQTLTLSTSQDSAEMNEITIVHTSNAYTYYNTELEVGAYVHVASPLMTTMSFPPQTGGYIVYSVNP